MHNALRTSIIGGFLLAFPVALLPQAAAAATVPDGRPPAATVAQQAQPPRFFVANLNIYGRDDESWPETDENVNRFYGPFEAVMDDGRPDYTFQVPHLGWGGECRVEVDGINAHLNPDGSILFTGMARLYEGTGENTSNLRAYKELRVTIPRKTRNFPYQERVTWDGGDFADIKWTFDNVINE